MLEKIRHLEILGRVHFATGKGGMPVIQVQTPWSTAEIYLNGAQVTSFQKTGEAPLLFESAKSYFAPGKAIRGGVPICFPWFGSREGEPAHGFARLTKWEVWETAATPEGLVTIKLCLPDAGFKPAWAGLQAEFTVTVGETLTLQLVAVNQSPDKILEIENCLHAYFFVGDISQVAITGLQGVSYLDTAADGFGAQKVDGDAVLKIVKETNRVYQDTTTNLEIHDHQLHRKISVEKSGSHSTVVWNPWTTQIMADFDPAEHKNMVCVEAANVKKNKIALTPGQSSVLGVKLGSTPLK